MFSVGESYTHYGTTTMNDMISPTHTLIVINPTHGVFPHQNERVVVLETVEWGKDSTPQKNSENTNPGCKERELQENQENKAHEDYPFLYFL